MIICKTKKVKSEDELFGIWKNNERVKDVNKYVKKLRKGRFNAVD